MGILKFLNSMRQQSSSLAITVPIHAHRWCPTSCEPRAKLCKPTSTSLSNIPSIQQPYALNLITPSNEENHCAGAFCTNYCVVVTVHFLDST